MERILARPGGEVLTDVGILIEAHPLNALDDARTARQAYKAVEKLFDARGEAPVRGVDEATILELGARHAVGQAAHRADEEVEAGEAGALAEVLLERLPGIPEPEDAFLEDLDYTVGRLRDLLGWLAVEAGGKPDADTVDGSVIGPEEALMEKVHTVARYDAAEKQARAEKVQEELLAERRDRILPGEADLEKIARYEAHLSRQMYQALHELEALQARRGGKAAPLARVDVQT